MFDSKTGKLVNLKQVKEDDDVMLISEEGIIIRTAANSISLIGRNTKGVKVMRMGDSDRVVSVAVTAGNEDDELEEGLEESVENTEAVETVAVEAEKVEVLGDSE